MRRIATAAAAFTIVAGSAEAAPSFGAKSYRATSSSEASTTASKAREDARPLAQRVLALLSIDFAPQFRAGDASAAKDSTSAAEGDDCEETVEAEKAEARATPAPARPRTKSASGEPLFLAF